MRVRYTALAFAAAALVAGQGAWAGEAEAKKWIDSEFQPSSLSKDQQAAELKWFIEAAKKLLAAPGPDGAVELLEDLVGNQVRTG